MAGPLDGIRVLDCATGIAGPKAAMLLADFGADVRKIEPAGGDPARRLPGFAVWNRGKRLARPEKMAAFIAGADVLVVSDSPERLRDTALDPERVIAAHPGLVYLHTPPFAGSTPWAGGDESAALLAAATGVALRQSSHEDVPVDSVYPHVLYVQAIWAAACGVAALIERESHGFGQIVTVGGMHGVMVAATGSLVVDPDTPQRHRPGGPGGPAPFYRPYECADAKWLFLAGLTPNFYMPAFDALGVMDIFTDDRLGGEPANMLRAENIPWVIERVATAFRAKSRDEWLDVLASVGCPAGPLLDREGWLDHPQVRAIGMRVEVEDPERGRVVMPGIPVVLTATPGSVKGTLSSGHTLEPWPPRPEPSDDAPSRSGPLAGCRIIELGSIIAGPYTGALLAELGALVLKVEPLTGDVFRGFGNGFVAYNKGVRSLAVDLRPERGREAFLRLVRAADAVVDNHRPGVLERLRIDHASLVRENPSIITLSTTGFGEGGPLGGEPGFDPILQAMSGMMTAQGGDADPVFFTVPVNDIAAAASGALGVCLAMFNRARTGLGQRVWTSLAGTAALMQSGELVRFDGRAPALEGGRDFQGPSAQERFQRTADGWIRVQGNVSDLSRKPTSEALAMLLEAGIPAAPARRVDDLPSVDVLVEAEMLHSHGRIFSAGRYARFSRTERLGVTVPPGLGEHTREVLHEAGFDDEAIARLVGEGVVAEGEPYVL